MADHPLDGEFRFLRREAEQLRAAFRNLGAAVSASGAGGSGGGGGGGGGGGQPVRTTEGGLFRGAAKDARELVRTVGELSRSAKAFGSFAKILGMDDASAKINQVGVALGRVQDALEGVAAASKVVLLAWRPLAAASVLFGVAAASVVGMQAAIKAATGDAVSFTGAIRATVLAVVRGIATAVGFVQEQVPRIGAVFDVVSSAIAVNFNRTLGAVFEKFADLASKTADALGEWGGPVTERLRAAAAGATLAVGALGVGVQVAVGNATQAVNDAQVRSARLAADSAAAIGGLDREINRVLSTPPPPGGAMAQFEELTTALGEAIPDAAKRALAAIGQVLAAPAETTTPKAERKEATPFEDFQKQLTQQADVTQQTFNAIGSAAQTVSATISDALIDGFINPQADIKAAFADMFAALAKMILQTIVQLLVAKALLTAIGGVGGAGATPGTVGAAGVGGIAGTLTGAFFGAAEGGRVPAGRFRASLAHAVARGYALGGRPAGLPASDTIPAWLTPGEFIIPRGPTAKMTRRSLEALRIGAIDAGALDALATGVPLPSSPAIPRVAYAGGGEVVGGGGGGDMGPAVVMVAPSETNLSRQLAGGHSALVRHFRENAASLKSALGVTK